MGRCVTAQNSVPQWHRPCDLRAAGLVSPNSLRSCTEPQVNLTRFHGVFAPNSKHRVQVTPAKRGKDRRMEGLDTNWRDKSPAERHRAMTWMQRLKRVFNIDIEVCEHCGGHVKVIASIEDPKVIQQVSSI